MSDSGGDRPAELDEEVDGLAMEAIRLALKETILRIGVDLGSAHDLFTNPRSFVKLSKGNNTVEEVILYVFVDSYRDYKSLSVLGEVVGNLEALQTLMIHQMYARRYDGGDDLAEREVRDTLYWQAFGSALGQARQDIELHFTGDHLAGIN